ncbi:hypothetical protein TNCT_504671 [Trichonephila clavata]|uniref:Uncharacterized protein n=1 Tax=Trichonephila clavata TaxID=2740835 RepID=A0A8X6FF07_TRICU|nr:hypothetical protein TNCT_504671 [Trichonephila clavata]
MPDNGVNTGPLFEILKPAPAGFKSLFRCLVDGSLRGLLQQISVDRSYLLANDGLRHWSCFSLSPTPSTVSPYFHEGRFAAWKSS